MEWGIDDINVLWVWLFIALGGAIGIWILFKKNERKRGFRRSIYFLIGLAGIGFLVTRPKYYSAAQKGLAILITEGNTDRINGQNVFSEVHTFLNDEIAPLTNKLEIHGFGLTPSDLSLLSNYQLEFQPTPLVSGITDLEVPRISEGEYWQLSGAFYGEDINQISLITPDGKRTEALLKDSLFQIFSKAPVAGDYMYTAELLFENGDTLRELLPITVHHPAEWNMLVLSSFPSFEINYLKNYWTQKGYGFGLRVKIAADSYISSFINMPKLDLGRISRGELEKFDFIMADVASWNALSAGERGLILESINDQGLSLIVRPDDRFERAASINHPVWTKRIETEYATPSDIILYSEYALPKTSWSSFANNSFNFGVYNSYGLGHIFVLGVDDTYKFILADEQLIYQEIWAGIFSRLFRDFNPATKLIHSEWVWAEEPTRMYISTYKEFTEDILIHDSIRVPYLVLPFIKGLYEVSLWPEEGTNNINIPAVNASLEFFAHPSDTWQAIRQKMLSEATAQAIKRNKNRIVEPPRFLQEIPFYWWYLLLLFGFGSLWLDETLFE